MPPDFPLAPEVREALQQMLDELESSTLQVVLVPERRRTHECGRIRVAISRNASWYRAFCARYLSSRKRKNLAPDTCIKRQQTIRSLIRLLSGHPPKGSYAFRLLQVATLRASSNPF